MSNILTKTVTDCSTGITEDVPLSQEEIEEYQAMQLAFESKIAEQQAADEAKAIAKASAKAKLEELGLTAEEIAALSN